MPVNTNTDLDRELPEPIPYIRSSSESNSDSYSEYSFLDDVSQVSVPYTYQTERDPPDHLEKREQIDLWLEKATEEDVDDTVDVPNRDLPTVYVPYDRTETVKDSHDGCVGDNPVDNDPITSDYQLYGVWETKVHVRDYRGNPSEGQYVMIRWPTTEKKTQWPYTDNDLCVHNVYGESIGMIKGETAITLMKYLNSLALLVEGYLTGPFPKTKAFHFENTQFPIVLKLFGTRDPIKRAKLRNLMVSDNLPTEVIDQPEHEAKSEEVKQEKPNQRIKRGSKRLAVAKKSKSEKGSSSQDVPLIKPDLNEPVAKRAGDVSPSLKDLIGPDHCFINRDFSGIVDQCNVSEDRLAKMPKTAKPKKMEDDSNFLPFQQQALAWLLQKERTRFRSGLHHKKDPDEMGQLWKWVPHEGKKIVCTNTATNYTKAWGADMVNGGILMDDVGLGRKLEMISLMFSEKAIPPPRAWSKLSLIVAPDAALNHWSTQIRRHIEKRQLKTWIYRGETLLEEDEVYEKYDVVITSYGTLVSEYFNFNEEQWRGPSPYGVPPVLKRHRRCSWGLFCQQWRRIILDEGHRIGNPYSKAAIAVSNLAGHSRWVLTTTPMVNSPWDLFSIIRFLGITGGLEKPIVFNAVLARPLMRGEENAFRIVRGLIESLSLRRTKDMKFVKSSLPKSSGYIETTRHVDFLPHERSEYETFRAKAKELLETIKHDSKDNDRKVQIKYRLLMDAIHRMRQICNHWKLCNIRFASSTFVWSILESWKVLDSTSENIEALQDVLELSMENRDDCSICLQTLHDPVILPCAHVFGRFCIKRIIQAQHCCPICRAGPFDFESLIRPAIPIEQKLEQPDPDGTTTSSKMDAICSILGETHKEPETKTVIVSCWASFRDMMVKRIAWGLPKESFQFNESMSADIRDKGIVTFSRHRKINIMLAPLSAFTAGLDLKAANQIIFAESWWAPGIEDQIIKRVRRLGQVRPVRIFRLAVNDTIESRVREIHAEERKRTGPTVQNVKAQKENSSRMTRLDDIERLLE